MTIEGVDFSLARPGGGSLAAAGKNFVVRYLWDPSSGGLSNAEIADYQANGIAVAVVMEQNPGDATLGFAKGVAHAQLAVQRLATLTLDQGLPIFFAVDEQVPWSSVSEYFRGVASVLTPARTGVYGSAEVVQGAQASGNVAFYWQTYAWSGSTIVPGIHMEQYRNSQTINGGSVDFCRAYQENYGQSPAGSTNSQGDDEEMISPETQQWLLDNLGSIQVYSADGSKQALWAVLKEQATELRALNGGTNITQFEDPSGAQSLQAESAVQLDEVVSIHTINAKLDGLIQSMAAKTA